MINDLSTKLLDFIPNFFKWRYRVLRRREYFIDYMIFQLLVFCIYLVVLVLPLNDPFSIFIKKYWYSLIFFIILFIIYLYVLVLKPKIESLFSMKDSLTPYGDKKHIPGNIYFNEIDHLIKRSEIEDVLNRIDIDFKNAEKRLVLLVGEPASGKTSIALSVGYRFWQNGFKDQVFYWNINSNKGCKNNADTIDCLLNDIKQNHREIILIIEDIHLKIDILEKLLIPLISSNKNLAVILTSRNIGKFEAVDSKQKSSLNNSIKATFIERDLLNIGNDKIVRIKSDLNLAQKIIKSSGFKNDNIILALARNKSGDNYNLVILDILLSIVQKAKELGKNEKDISINSSDMFRFIESRIDQLWEIIKSPNTLKDDYLKILFILSSFSSYEFPIDISFLNSYFHDSQRVLSIVDELVNKCEVYCVKQHNDNGYILLHSKYAEIVNDTLKSCFNIHIDLYDILFDYYEKGNNRLSFFNRLLDETTISIGYQNRNEKKQFSIFAHLIKTMPERFRKIKLAKYELFEINLLFEEIECISSQIVKEIIKNNLDEIRSKSLENVDLVTSIRFIRFCQSYSEELCVHFIKSLTYNNDIYLNKIKLVNNEVLGADTQTIGLFIDTLSLLSEDFCISFIKENCELLKSKLYTTDARELSMILCIWTTYFEKVNRTVINYVFRESVEEIFNSDIQRVLKFLHWDWWTHKGEVLVYLIETYLLGEKMKIIVQESSLENISNFFMNLGLLKSPENLMKKIFIHLNDEIIEKIKKCDLPSLTKFINSISWGYKDFLIFIKTKIETQIHLPV